MDPSTVSDVASNFSGLQGYLVIVAIFLGPALGVWSSQIAKRVFGAKTEDVAAEAVKQGQEEASTGFLALTQQLSKALSDERTAHQQTRDDCQERIDQLERENRRLRRQIDEDRDT